MASLTRIPKVIKELGTIHKFSRTFSVSTTCNERFGTSKGESGWKWDKGGVGMGGKETGPATQIKPGLGKGKAYQVPEFFEYDQYSYFSIEKDMAAQRVPQPKSGATEYWADREK